MALPYEIIPAPQGGLPTPFVHQATPVPTPPTAGLPAISNKLPAVVEGGAIRTARSLPRGLPVQAGGRLAFGPAATATMVLDPLARVTAAQAQRSGQPLPTQIATQTKPTTSWGAPTSTGAISFTSPFTGAPVKKTTNTSMTPMQRLPIHTQPGSLNLPSQEEKPLPVNLASAPTTPTYQLPPRPEVGFEPGQLEMIRGQYNTGMQAAREPLAANRELANRMLQARLNTSVNPYSNPLGAIVAGAQTQGLAGQVMGANTQASKAELEGMQTALPQMGAAYKEGDELRKAGVLGDIGTYQKLRQEALDPMFKEKREKMVAEAEKARHEATAAKPGALQATYMENLLKQEKDPAKQQKLMEKFLFGAKEKPTEVKPDMLGYIQTLDPKAAETLARQMGPEDPYTKYYVMRAKGLL